MRTPHHRICPKCGYAEIYCECPTIDELEELGRYDEAEDARIDEERRVRDIMKLIEEEEEE